MAGISNPSMTYTLEDFIEAGQSDQLTYTKFSIINEINGVKFASMNIVSDYINELKKLCVPVPKENITPEQIARYKYNPDLLAYDLYGSTQLDFVILFINDMIDPKDFDRTRIYLPYASALSEFLDRVYTANYTLLQQNRLDNNIIL